MWHAQRDKMCVCARPVRCTVYSSRRVQGSCHCLDAKSRKKKKLQINNLGFSVVEKSVKKKMLRRRSCVDVDNFRLGVRNRASGFPVLGSTSWERESMLSHLTTFQTTHCLSIRVDASPKSRRTRSTRMNLVSRKKRMSAGVVLLQNTQPN